MEDELNLEKNNKTPLSLNYIKIDNKKKSLSTNKIKIKKKEFQVQDDNINTKSIIDSKLNDTENFSKIEIASDKNTTYMSNLIDFNLSAYKKSQKEKENEILSKWKKSLIENKKKKKVFYNKNYVMNYKHNNSVLAKFRGEIEKTRKEITKNLIDDKNKRIKEIQNKINKKYNSFLEKSSKKNNDSNSTDSNFNKSRTKLIKKNSIFKEINDNDLSHLSSQNVSKKDLHKLLDNGNIMNNKIDNRIKTNIEVTKDKSNKQLNSLLSENIITSNVIIDNNHYENKKIENSLITIVNDKKSKTIINNQDNIINNEENLLKKEENLIKKEENLEEIQYKKLPTVKLKSENNQRNNFKQNLEHKKVESNKNSILKLPSSNSIIYNSSNNISNKTIINLSQKKSKKKTKYFRKRNFIVKFDARWSIENRSLTKGEIIKIPNFQFNTINDEILVLQDNLKNLKSIISNNVDCMTVFKTLHIKDKLLMNIAIEDLSALLYDIVEILLKEFTNYVENFIKVPKVSKDRLKNDIIYDENTTFIENLDLLKDLMTYFKACMHSYSILVKHVNDMSLASKSFSKVKQYLERSRYLTSRIIFLLDNDINDYNSDLAEYKKFKSKKIKAIIEYEIHNADQNETYELNNYMRKVKEKIEGFGSVKKDLSDKIKSQFDVKRKFGYERDKNLSFLLSKAGDYDIKGTRTGVDYLGRSLEKSRSETVKLHKGILVSSQVNKLLKYVHSDFKNKIISNVVIERFSEKNIIDETDD